MREAWRELRFSDAELEEHASTRDPVAPAERSRSARHKAATRRLEDGTQVYCFRTLIENLQTITRNTCRARTRNAQAAATGTGLFDVTTNPSEKQHTALELLKNIGSDQVN